MIKLLAKNQAAPGVYDPLEYQLDYVAGQGPPFVSNILKYYYSDTNLLQQPSLNSTAFSGHGPPLVSDIVKYCHCNTCGTSLLK